jgi:hypothetical protein
VLIHTQCDAKCQILISECYLLYDEYTSIYVELHGTASAKISDEVLLLPLIYLVSSMSSLALKCSSHFYRSCFWTDSILVRRHRMSDFHNHCHYCAMSSSHIHIVPSLIKSFSPNEAVPKWK